MPQSNTGSSDAFYDLVSCLYHALQGAETCEQYIQDAREQNDPELERLYSDWQRTQRDFAQRARALMERRIAAAEKGSTEQTEGEESQRRGATQPRPEEPQRKGEVARRRPPRDADNVDEASWESFPASDPPAY